MSKATSKYFICLSVIWKKNIFLKIWLKRSYIEYVIYLEISYKEEFSFLYK